MLFEPLHGLQRCENADVEINVNRDVVTLDFHVNLAFDFDFKSCAYARSVLEPFLDTYADFP